MFKYQATIFLWSKYFLIKHQEINTSILKCKHTHKSMIIMANPCDGYYDQEPYTWHTFKSH